MMISLPTATHFRQVSREAVLRAGELLGLPENTSEHELDRLTEAIPRAMASVVQEIESQNAACPDALRSFLGGELHVVRAIQHIVLPFMLKRVARVKTL